MVHRPSNIFDFFDVYIYKNNISQDIPIRLLFVFEAFWYNEMGKYGLPGLRKSRNHGNVTF